MQSVERSTPRLLTPADFGNDCIDGLPQSHKQGRTAIPFVVNTVMIEPLLLLCAVESGDATKREFAVNCNSAPRASKV
jgi:hypothetical protein